MIWTSNDEKKMSATSFWSKKILNTNNGNIIKFLSWSRFIQNEWHNSLFDNFTPVKDLITKHSGDYEGIVVMSPAKKVSSVVKVLPLSSCSGCSSLFSFPSQKEKKKSQLGCE